MWYLVRHPETEWNSQMRYQGWTDVPLSNRGRQQAEELVLFLSGLEFAELILSSDLTRCRVVAERISTQLQIPLHTTEKLREVNFGAWEGLSFDEITEAYGDTQKRWLCDPLRIAPDQGESLEEAADRVLRFLLSYDNKNVIIVTHGGIIALVLEKFVGHNLWDLLPPTASCTCIDPKTKAMRRVFNSTQVGDRP